MLDSGYSVLEWCSYPHLHKFVKRELLSVERINYRIEPGMMPGSNEFPGDYTDGETPDPIPNSEAKPVRPMVVLTGESRYRQEL